MDALEEGTEGFANGLPKGAEIKMAEFLEDMSVLTDVENEAGDEGNDEDGPKDDIGDVIGGGGGCGGGDSFLGDLWGRLDEGFGSG